MEHILLAAGISLVLSAVIGKILIPFLISLKAGQSIKEIGPTWHMSKQGTPTMGGLMFIAGIGIAVLIGGWQNMLSGRLTHLYIYLFALIFGVIGFVDDYVKVKHHHNDGLSAIQKLILQIIAAVIFLIIMRHEEMLTPSFYVPFFNVTINTNWVVYLVIAVFIIVGTVNAVNITDGVDGLVSSVSLPVALFFGVIGFIWKNCETVGICAGAMFGGLVAFLIYNHHPAKVFMGDTGSLFLGGLVAALAFASNMPLILVVVGIIYLCETFSDILQVGYFKLTHGKRIFKMAPLHHHFEMCGWNETKVVVVFSSVSLIFCILAYLGIINRF